MIFFQVRSFGGEKRQMSLFGRQVEHLQHVFLDALENSNMITHSYIMKSLCYYLACGLNLSGS